MGNLIPNEVIIYERVGHKLYARYLNRPEIPRWTIGYLDVDSNQYNYQDWQSIKQLTKTNKNFKEQFDKLMTMYYILKDDNN